MKQKLWSGLAIVLASALVWSATSFAADLQTSSDLSTDLALPTEVSIGANPFTINLSATGNLPDNRSGTAQVSTVYNMATTGVITADTTSRETVTFLDNYNYSQCDTQSPADAQGCASNPFVINATLNVAAGTLAGTTGVLTVDHVGSQSLDADGSPATGQVIVVVNAADITFDGFFSPVDDVNKAKAGQAIPLKWLTYSDLVLVENDAEGHGIQSQKVSLTNCGEVLNGPTEDLGDIGMTGKTEIRWDETAPQYIANWKTEKGWKDTCREVILTYDDGDGGVGTLDGFYFYFTK